MWCTLLGLIRDRALWDPAITTIITNQKFQSTRHIATQRNTKLHSETTTKARFDRPAFIFQRTRWHVAAKTRMSNQFVALDELRLSTWGHNCALPFHSRVGLSPFISPWWLANQSISQNWGEQGKKTLSFAHGNDRAKLMSLHRPQLLVHLTDWLNKLIY